jgi:DNA-directed RNA polymerase alpha subunit
MKKRDDDASASELSLDESVRVLELSVREENAMEFLGVKTLRQLLSFSLENLYAPRLCGRPTAESLKEKLGALLPVETLREISHCNWCRWYAETKARERRDIELAAIWKEIESK